MLCGKYIIIRLYFEEENKKKEENKDTGFQCLHSIITPGRPVPNSKNDAGDAVLERQTAWRSVGLGAVGCG